MFSAQDISVKIFILFITNNFWLVNKIVFTTILCVKYFLYVEIFWCGLSPRFSAVWCWVHGKCCMTAPVAENPRIPQNCCFSVSY